MLSSIPPPLDRTPKLRRLEQRGVESNDAEIEVEAFDWRLL